MQIQSFPSGAVAVGEGGTLIHKALIDQNFNVWLEQIILISTFVSEKLPLFTLFFDKTGSTIFFLIKFTVFNEINNCSFQFCKYSYL